MQAEHRILQCTKASLEQDEPSRSYMFEGLPGKRSFSCPAPTATAVFNVPTRTHTHTSTRTCTRTCTHTYKLDHQRNMPHTSETYTHHVYRMHAHTLTHTDLQSHTDAPTLTHTYQHKHTHTHTHTQAHTRTPFTPMT